MTDQVPIDEIGWYSEKKVDRLVRAVVLEADKLVKEGSPVDTGRFAVSWQIGENKSDGQPAKEGNYGKVVRPPQGVNPNSIKAAHTYHIHNNLPYAEPLCYQGHSQKVDSNWFEMIAKEMQGISKQFWQSIVKKDL
tara:strand:+ start:1150 stop:1557 length:408 start_codon:yes stop_codon:yes gene_type:complete